MGEKVEMNEVFDDPSSEQASFLLRISTKLEAERIRAVSSGDHPWAEFLTGLVNAVEGPLVRRRERRGSCSRPARQH